ncbi:MAG: IS1634 family transposase [Acidobacteriota bacterium]
MAKRNGAVHVATTTRKHKGKVYQTHLLRRSYREGGKVKHETLGNLSHLPADLIETIRRRLRGESPPEGGPWEIVRSLPHGHVAAVLGTIERMGLDTVIASRSCRERTLVIAMIVARILHPSSKLASVRALQAETATSSLSLELGLEDVAEREVYQALDWLGRRQSRMENKLARQHLYDGTLLLYDVSSSYYTGSRPDLVQYGYSRDGRRRFPQIVYGLLCNTEGCPVSVDVFAGNTADPSTLASQIAKVRTRFGIARVVMVGDRGLITSKRIDEDLRGTDGLDWITALRAEGIQKLASQGVIQMSLFDDRDLAEVTSDDFPDERLVVCRNPLLAERRRAKREELLKATEKKLDEIVAAVARKARPLKGKEKIGVRIGKVLNQYKVGKHFVLHICETSFSYQREAARIAAEAALDGVYVIRTSLEQQVLSAENTVRSYKDLAKVERAFRSMKTVDLKVRPIYHWLDERIRAHVFLCMLAYYVEWHLRQRLAPILFDDHRRAAAEQTRQSIVTAAPRSDQARRKDSLKRTEDDQPVESFQTLLANLGTLTKNRVRVPGSQGGEFYVSTQPTPFQQHVLEMLGISP